AVQSGVTFATLVLTNRAELATLPTLRDNSPEISATNARIVCGRVKTRLPDLVKLANTEPRSLELQGEQNAVSNALSAADRIIAIAYLNRKCKQAKDQALVSEQSGKWSEAITNWNYAETICGPTNADVNGGFQFARAMTAAADATRQAQGLQGAAVDKLKS